MVMQPEPAVQAVQYEIKNNLTQTYQQAHNVGLWLVSCSTVIPAHLLLVGAAGAAAG